MKEPLSTDVERIDLGQTRRDGYVEAPILTSGEDLSVLLHYLKPGHTRYSAADAVNHLLPPAAGGD